MWPTLVPAIRALRGHAPGSRERLIAARDRALRRLIRHAWDRVPYYRRLFEQRGIDPDSIRRAADLRAVPITTKEDLREAGPRATVARGLDPDRLHRVRTGGATAEPFTIWQTWWERFLSFGYWLRAYRDWGGRSGDRHASIRYAGHREHRRATFYTPVLRFLGMNRRFVIDADAELDDILRDLRAFRPDTLDGIPSVLLRVAERVTEQDRRLIRPRLVGTGSETVTEGMKRCIQAAFGAPLYMTYGSHELNLIAWECPETGELHTCDDAVTVEVLRDGQPADPGEEGELVGTNLFCYAMPFIRYRLADVVVQGSPRCACGAPFGTLRTIQGRTLDYLRLPGGRLLHPYRLVGEVVYGANWIKRYRFTQESEDRVTLQVSLLREPPPGAVRAMEGRLAAKLGPEVQFRMGIVPDISPPRGQKFRLLRSSLTGKRPAR